MLDEPAELADDAVDLRRGDHMLGRRHEYRAFLGYLVFEVCHLLHAVGVVLDQRLASVEKREQRVVAVLLELVRVAVQVDADDSLHGVLPCGRSSVDGRSGSHVPTNS